MGKIENLLIEKTDAWIVVRFNMETPEYEILDFLGFMTYKQALKTMIKKHKKEGHWDKGSLRFESGINEWYELQAIPMNNKIVAYIDIENNNFEIETNIPGAQVIMFYYDGEFSKTIHSKAKSINLEYALEMIGYIKEEQRGSTKD